MVAGFNLFLTHSIFIMRCNIYVAKPLTWLKRACVEQCTQSPPNDTDETLSPTSDVIEGLCILPSSKKHLNLTYLPC